MSKILETNNYLKFELSSFNREVSKTKALETSMLKYGWIDAYPLHVYRNGAGKLIIKAGHHRFEVARRLGIPVKYVECKDDATISELELATNPWDLKDYLISFVRLGNPNYVEILEYHQNTGITLSLCISMLGGQSAGSGNLNKAFKAGRYKLGDPTHAGIVGDIILHCKKCGIPWNTHLLFVQAVSKIAFVNEFDVNLFKNKISKHRQLMQKQPTQQAYMELIDTVYNYASRKRIPLVFLAEENAKARNVAKS